jgi:hypothetical protein
MSQCPFCKEEGMPLGFKVVGKIDFKKEEEKGIRK